MHYIFYCLVSAFPPSCTYLVYKSVNVILKSELKTKSTGWSTSHHWQDAACIDLGCSAIHITSAEKEHLPFSLLLVQIGNFTCFGLQDFLCMCLQVCQLLRVLFLCMLSCSITCVFLYQQSALLFSKQFVLGTSWNTPHKNTQVCLNYNFFDSCWVSCNLNNNKNWHCH